MRVLTSTINAMSDKRDAYELQRVLQDVYNRFRSVALTTAGLVINGAANPAARTGASITYFSVEGKPLSVAANTVLPAFTGTVANALFCPYVFTIDKSGTTYIQQGTAGATLAASRFPEIAADRAIVGVVIINPTVGTFTGGTSALDSTAANAVYISPVGAWDPSATV
jgi:hypothetical protein